MKWMFGISDLARVFSIVPANLDVFGKETQDGEQTGQSASSSNLVQQLISIHILAVPGTALTLHTRLAGWSE